jgi:RNA polymerase sigma factor (sigma-70 family)
VQISNRDADELYYKHEGLVKKSLERGFPNHHSFAKIHGLDKDDLLQLGKIGLFKATKGYDSSKGASFETYARKIILYTIMTEAKKYSVNNKDNRTYDLVDKTSMEYPIASTDGDVVDLHDVVEAKDDAFDEIELDMMLQKVSGKVSANIVEAVKMRCYLYTFEEIGLALGMSSQGVQQMLKKNREILSEYLLAN